jgi:hypothetical protein
MPLALPALVAGLQSTFADPPADAAGCAQGWADAVQSWASGIVPPSTAVSAAASALAGSLASAFSNTDAASAMESAFATFAAAVGLGMAGHTPIPPAAPVGFAQQFESKPATHAEAAQAIGGIIDAWMKTGTATLIAPPNTVIPWS